MSSLSVSSQGAGCLTKPWTLKTEDSKTCGSITYIVGCLSGEGDDVCLVFITLKLILYVCGVSIFVKLYINPVKILSKLFQNQTF